MTVSLEVGRRQAPRMVLRVTRPPATPHISPQLVGCERLEPSIRPVALQTFGTHRVRSAARSSAPPHALRHVHPSRSSPWGARGGREAGPARLSEVMGCLGCSARPRSTLLLPLPSEAPWHRLQHRPLAPAPQPAAPTRDFPTAWPCLLPSPRGPGTRGAPAPVPGCGGPGVGVMRGVGSIARAWGWGQLSSGDRVA